MPRRGKGSQYQSPSAENSQAYGDKVANIEAQKEVPIHREPTVGERAPDPAQAQGQPQQQVDPMQQLLALAQGFDAQGGVTPLGAPSTNPDEALTAGIAGGTGPGPEALSPAFRVQARNRVADTLQMVADMTGNPQYQELAQRARRTQGRTPAF